MLDINKINQIADIKVRRQLKLDILNSAKKKQEALIRSDFLTFVKYIWPEFIEGDHHKTIADKFFFETGQQKNSKFLGSEAFR